MKTVIFDCETTGLDYKDPNFKIHCVCTMDVETGEEKTFLSHQLRTCINYINKFDRVVGHNIQFFDIPVIEYQLNEIVAGTPFDTKTLAAMMFPTVDGHSLSAWGNRLGLSKKTEFTYTNFKECTPEMIEQCVRDVRITEKLYKHLLAQDFSQEAIDLETSVASIIQKQIARGIRFDEDKAKALYLNLGNIKLDLEKELRTTFKPWFKIGIEKTPKVNNKNRGISAGNPYCPLEFVLFNPNSNDHIIQVLRKQGWIPTEFTETNTPKVDSKVLLGLDYPEAKLLAKYKAVVKIIGMLSDGDNSWIKTSKNGRIHASVFTTGTVTGRMSSAKPNLQQVTGVEKLYGKECRELFLPDEGKVMLGCDASSLEARCLAHYLAKYDNRTYSNVLESGVDLHEYNAKLLNLSRKDAKTIYYAILYGAGIRKLAKSLNVSEHKASNIKRQLLTKIPSLQNLMTDVEIAAKKGFLYGLDRRKVYVKSSHAALNTLLQSAGAVLMKKALVLALERRPSLELLLSVHDEFQIQCKPEEVDSIGQTMIQCIKDAGKAFNFRCELDANFKSGKNWSETH